MANNYSNLTTFAEEVVKAIYEKYGIEAKISETKKNNGKRSVGIMIRRENSNIAPIVYVSEYIKAIEDGKLDFDRAVTEIYETIEENQTENFDVEWFKDYSVVRDKLFIKLINAQANLEYLQDIAHVLVGDLAVIFQIRISDVSADSYYGTITVRNEHMTVWDKSVQELCADAVANTDAEGYTVKSLLETLREMMVTGSTDEFGLLEDSFDGPEMFVISNHTKINGAAAILNNSVLQSIADRLEGDLAIIPSSIHECIAVKVNPDFGFDSLAEMIFQVNTNEVKPEEVLSDHAYFFSRSLGKLCLDAGGEVMELKYA